MDLKAKLEQDMAAKGEVTLNQATLAHAATEAAASTERKPDMLNQASTVKLSDRVKNDSVLKAAKDGSTSDLMANEMVKAKTVADVQSKMVVDLLNPDEAVEITPEEKRAFLDAIIANTRYVRTFSLFDGQYTGEIRTRTQAETFAIFQQLNKELRDGNLESQLSYSMRLRNMLFAAQIKRLNGQEFTELKAPLLPLVDGGETKPIGWLDQAALWDGVNDGMANVIYNELKRFEYKYLTMLENSGNQNFWKTELPI